MNEKEKAVVYAVLDRPELLEKVSIKHSLFKGQALDLLKELDRQYQKTQSFSWEECSDRLKIKHSVLHSMFDGCYRFKVGQLESTLRAIEVEQLNRKLLLLVDKEIKAEIKTGTIDESKVDAIERTFRQRSVLSDGKFPSDDFTNVEEKEIDWLWTGRIPVGMLTLVAGHPGTGKSFFCTWLASKISIGSPLPGPSTFKPLTPSSTLLISAEDDPEQTIKPRLRGNGADFSKIIYFKEPLKFSLDKIRILDRMLDEYPDIRLIVIDPLTAFLGTKTDYFKDPDVRLKLIPLKELAERRRIAVVAVVHLNKKEDSEFITRIGGSIAFAGVARSVLGITYDNRDTEEDTQDVRLLVSGKMNLQRKPDTLAFRINSNLEISFDSKPVLFDAEMLFSKESRERKCRQTFADTWLVDYLKNHPKALSKEVIIQADDENIAQASIYRAKKKLENQGLLEVIETGFSKDHKSFWELK